MIPSNIGLPNSPQVQKKYGVSVTGKPNLTGIQKARSVGGKAYGKGGKKPTKKPIKKKTVDQKYSQQYQKMYGMKPKIK